MLPVNQDLIQSRGLSFYLRMHAVSSTNEIPSSV